MCRNFVIFVIPVISVQPTILVLTLDTIRENDPKLLTIEGKYFESKCLFSYTD